MQRELTFTPPLEAARLLVFSALGSRYGSCCARAMRPSPRVVALFLFAAAAAVVLSLAGCGWRHAPGHHARAQMTETKLPMIVPQVCFTGGCDLAGPGGRVDITIQEAATLGNRRDNTAFEMTYLGAKSACRGPAIGPDGTEVAFACSIDAPDKSSRHILVLDPGCTRGTLREVDPAREIRSTRLETDVVEVAGHSAPGIEVTLSDEHRVLAHSEAQSSGVYLFTPKDRATTPAELLALLSLHAFRELEGAPPQCVRN
jgi:hypothetical protein